MHFTGFCHGDHVQESTAASLQAGFCTSRRHSVFDLLWVSNSMQIKLIGSDGMHYLFLAKPKDDLRKVSSERSACQLHLFQAAVQAADPSSQIPQLSEISGLSIPGFELLQPLKAESCCENTARAC